MKLIDFTPEERCSTPHHHIDPGFINRRQCFSTFGSIFISIFDKHKKQGNDHLTILGNDHLLVTLALSYCKGAGIKSLGEVLNNPVEGILFCSTEELEGNEDVYHKERVRNRIILPYEYDKNIFLEFGTSHIVADTGRLELSQKSKVSIIAGIRHIDQENIISYPLIMGAPSFDHPWNKDFGIDPAVLMWYGWEWYEVFPQDIHQFHKITDFEEPSSKEWTKIMSMLPESEVKRYFCEILGDVQKKDWGGEQDDHFTSCLRLANDNVTAAFIFKGPSKFREMTPDILGTRADQIYRLACTPAQLLIVQHCHQIGEAVRATLRAFSVTPHNPRRYCFIDGKNTYKILKAYGKI